MFVSTFHTGKLTIPNWKMPTLNAFIESLTNDHDKLVHMVSIRSSKDKDLFFGVPKDLNAKVNPNQKEKTKFDHPKQKENTKQSNEPSESKKYKQNGKKEKCSYSGHGFHPEIS